MSKEQKEAIRRATIERRKDLSRQEIIEESARIKELLFGTEEFQEASIVMFYASFGSEVETYKMIEESLALGKKVYLPIAIKEKRTLEAALVANLSELKKGAYGILEPEKANIVSPNYLDLVIVPGVAFDIKGYRLGYGAGYYDNFLIKLQKNATTIGLAFELQILESIPHEKFDVRVDKIITPARTIDPCTGP